MKKLVFLLAVTGLTLIARGQNNSGGVISGIIHSAFLQNTGGENPNRKVSVYLPPDYGKSKQHYTVIYYLHGFMSTDSISPGMKAILDSGISKKKIRPFILVISDQYTLFAGSFYTNSSLTGNWADFTAKDLVNYLDENFITIPVYTDMFYSSN